MQKKEELQRLKNLYHELEKFKIPKCSKNEVLASWLDNVMELDAYYAGLALTASEGGKISSKDLYDIAKLKYSLNDIKSYSEEDKYILDECKSYLKIIEQIDFLLHDLSKNWYTK